MNAKAAGLLITAALVAGCAGTMQDQAVALEVCSEFDRINVGPTGGPRTCAYHAGAPSAPATLASYESGLASSSSGASGPAPSPSPYRGRNPGGQLAGGCLLGSLMLAGTVPLLGAVAGLAISSVCLPVAGVVAIAHHVSTSEEKP
jgi:hypothetical protein